MPAKNVVLLFIAVVALGAAGVIVVNRSGGGVPAEESMDRAVYLVCQNSQCKNEFEMTMREFASARSAGGPPECPECGEHKNRQAHKCEQCARFVKRIGHAELPPECPFCGYDFVEDVESFGALQEQHKQLGLDGDDGG